MNDNGHHAASAATRLIATGRVRAVAIDSYGILDTPPEAAFDDLVALAAEICGTPIAAFSLICPARQWFKAKVGLGATETPIVQSFCAHAVARGGSELFEVRDAAQDPRFAANPIVLRDPHVRFYAGAPLITVDGVGVGALCVIDSEARPRGLSALQTRTLRTLADQIVAQLELRRTIAQREHHASRHASCAQELQWLGSHDSLTGLPNRAYLQARLREAIAKDGGSNRLALVALNLDQFKSINDTFGHEVGDEMLRTFAERLRSFVRDGDTVARIGGDEFAIVMPGLQRPDDLERITSSIAARMAEPLICSGQPIECHATIGAAIYPDHASDAAELTRNTDIALDFGKRTSRGRAAVFGAEMLAVNRRRTAMIARASTALDSGWIVPFYQPKIDLATGGVVGFEALLRVRQPDAPIGMPGSIFAAFDDSALAIRLSDAMIAQVAADMRRWDDAGVAYRRIAVNASAAEFRDAGFCDRLLDALRSTGARPERLELEVTETVFLDGGASNVADTLRRLSAAGLRIALDDFGTGYASLSHLQQFPVDVIKIDQSFVRRLQDGKDSGVIVNALLNLGANLGIETVAEGIETRAQATYLRENGCRIGQGFLYDQALPAESVPAAIAQREPVVTAGNVRRLRPNRRRPDAVHAG